MYAVLYVVESSVRTRTGALWSQSQILDPGVGLELTTTRPVADVRALSGKTLRAYLDGQQSMLDDYLRHPAAHASDSEVAHHPRTEVDS